MDTFSINKLYSVISFHLLVLGARSQKEGFSVFKQGFICCIRTAFMLWPQSLEEMKNMLSQEKQKSLQIPPKP